MSDTYVLKDTEGKELARFWGSSSLTVGDYVGSGSIGASNMRTIRAQAGEGGDDAPRVLDLHYTIWDYLLGDRGGYVRFRGGDEDEDVVEAIRAIRAGEVDVIHVTGWGYGAQSMYINEGSTWGENTIRALEGYSLLDEDEHSAVEEEGFNEAFDDISWSQLKLPKWMYDVHDGEHESAELHEIDEDITELVRQTADEMRSYGTIREEGGVWYMAEGKLGKAVVKDVLALRDIIQATFDNTESNIQRVCAEAVRDGHLEQTNRASLELVLDELGVEDLDEVQNFPGTRDERSLTHYWADSGAHLIAWLREQGQTDAADAAVRRIAAAVRPLAPFAADELESPAHRTPEGPKKNPAPPQQDPEEIASESAALAADAGPVFDAEGPIAFPRTEFTRDEIADFVDYCVRGLQSLPDDVARVPWAQWMVPSMGQALVLREGLVSVELRVAWSPNQELVAWDTEGRGRDPQWTWSDDVRNAFEASGDWIVQERDEGRGQKVLGYRYVGAPAPWSESMRRNPDDRNSRVVTAEDLDAYIKRFNILQDEDLFAAEMDDLLAAGVDKDAAAAQAAASWRRRTRGWRRNPTTPRRGPQRQVSRVVGEPLVDVASLTDGELAEAYRRAEENKTALMSVGMPASEISSELRILEREIKRRVARQRRAKKGGA